MDMDKIENENDTEDDINKDFESLERDIEKNKKTLDRQTDILNDAIKEMTDDKEV